MSLDVIGSVEGFKVLNVVSFSPEEGFTDGNNVVYKYVEMSSEMVNGISTVVGVVLTSIFEESIVESLPVE